MNIPTIIMDEAERLGLKCIATGGGYDYVYRKVSDKVSMTLSCEDDDGSPHTLDERGYVTIWTDANEWQQGIGIKFKNVKKAMKFMAKVEMIDLINS